MHTKTEIREETKYPGKIDLNKMGYDSFVHFASAARIATGQILEKLEALR